MKNVNAEAKQRIHRVSPLQPNELLQRWTMEKEPRVERKKQQSSHQFLGCWFFVSNLLTSPIHNIFTGYFFKICIGRVLKTSKVLLIMDDGPGCSVRCLLSGWQQRLTRTLPVVSSQRPWDEEQRIGWHFQTLPLKIRWLSDFFSLSFSLRSLFWTIEKRYQGTMNVTLRPPSRSREEKPWSPCWHFQSICSTRSFFHARRLAVADELVVMKVRVFRGIYKSKVANWKKERRRDGSCVEGLEVVA